MRLCQRVPKVAAKRMSRVVPATDPQSAATGVGRRVADATALAGLGVALAAVLAVVSVLIVEPVLVSLQGPDPCSPEVVGRAGGVVSPFFPPDKQAVIACFSAHPDYYQYDPVADSWSTPASRFSRTIEPIAGPAVLPLAIVAALISCLALAMRTRYRRAAISALTVSAFIVLGMIFLFLALFFGGGD